MPLLPHVQELCRRLRENDPNLTTINLALKRIGDEDATALARALSANTVLRELDLGNNKIGDKSIKEFAKALESSNTRLQKLWLRGNRIGDVGVEEIARALQSNTTLQKLELYNNRISNGGAKALLLTLQEYNGTLTSLPLTSKSCNNNLEESTAQEIKALVQQNKKGIRDPVPKPRASFLGALEGIRTLVEKTPDGQAVSIVPLLKQSAQSMRDFWQLKHLYTAIHVYYRLGAIAVEDRTTLIQYMLTTAKQWCRTPFETALYRITLEHARQQGIINDLQGYWLEELARLGSIENADFVRDMQELIRQNTQRLHKVEMVQHAMYKAIVQLHERVDQNFQLVRRNFHQLSHQMQTMALAVNQVQDNVERVNTSYSSFIASYQRKVRIEAACDMVSTIMNIVSFGVAGSALKGALGFTLGNLVDLSDLAHIRSVVTRIDSSVVTAAEDLTEGLTVKELFEKGVELAEENFADRKLEEAISNEPAIVQFSASVAVFSQAWELGQDEATSNADAILTLPSIMAAGGGGGGGGANKNDASAGRVIPGVQSPPVQKLSKFKGRAAQARFLDDGTPVSPTGLREITTVGRLERLEHELEVGEDDIAGKTIKQRLAICEERLGDAVWGSTVSQRILHLEEEMGLA